MQSDFGTLRQFNLSTITFPKHVLLHTYTVVKEHILSIWQVLSCGFWDFQIEVCDEFCVCQILEFEMHGLRV